MAEFTLEEITNLEEGMKRIEELARTGLGMDKLTGYLSDLFNKFSVSSEGAAKLTERIKGVAVSVTELVDIGKVANDMLGMMTKFVNNNSAEIDRFKRATGDAGISTAGLAVKIGMINPAAMRLQDVPEHFNSIGESVKTSQAQISSLLSNSKVFDAFGSALASAFPDTIFEKKDIDNMAKMLDAHRNLQKGMLETAAASGNLSEFVKNAGSNFENLDAMTVAYNDKVTRIAASTGRLPSEVGKLERELARIPGALNSMNVETTIAGSKMNMLEAALRFADGSGQDANKVFEDLGFAANTLGLQGEDALQFLDRMKQASDATNLPMDMLKESIKSTADEFAMLGDNTDAAVNLIGRLAPALRDVGVAPTQVNKIFKELTSSISGMSTAQKAFLSSSTGGAAGLQGAFQIEQMLAEGKMDQVFSKMQQNLRNKIGGGPILTREQAAQSPEQAAQYQRQVMLMMSPAMGSMAKDSNSAAKLLEAMSKGDLTQFAKGMAGDTEQDKDRELQKTMQTGVKIQEKTNSALIELNANLSRITGNNAAALGQMLPSMDATIRDALNLKTTKEVRDDSAQLSRANPFTGKGFGSSVEVRELYDRLGNNPQIQQAIMDMQSQGVSIDRMVEFLKATVGGVTGELGISRKQNVPYDAEQEMKTNEQLNAVSSAYGPTDLLMPNTPEQRTARVIERSEAQVQNQTATQPVATNNKQETVQVNVTTVCSDCNKKIAQNAAKEAIKHQHGSNLSQAQTGVGR